MQRSHNHQNGHEPLLRSSRHRNNVSDNTMFICLCVSLAIFSEFMLSNWIIKHGQYYGFKIALLAFIGYESMIQEILSLAATSLWYLSPNSTVMYLVSLTQFITSGIGREISFVAMCDSTDITAFQCHSHSSIAGWKLKPQNSLETLSWWVFLCILFLTAKDSRHQSISSAWHCGQKH